MPKYAVYYSRMVIKDTRTGKDAIYPTLREANEKEFSMNQHRAGFYVALAPILVTKGKRKI